MRFRRLDLIAFGHFTDLSIDLVRPADLHLFYGANEAGKTTALRAIHELLYGMPVRTDLAFLHPMNRLRVGAVIEGVDGQTLEVVRRKGRLDTLRTPDGAVVEESRLTALLGGVGPQLFRTMFGVDHAGLVAGGQELLQGEGEVGRSLFGAAVGASRVHSLLAELERQAEEIYRPRGTRSLNQALADHDATRRRARELQLRPHQWQALYRTHEDARATREVAEEQVVRQDAELRRLQRLQAALPLLARRRRLLELTAELGETPEVPAAVARRHRELVESLHGAAERERDSQEQLGEVERALAGLEVDEVILARAHEIRGVAHGRGRYEKDARDRDALKGTLQETISQAGSLLRQVWPDVRVEDADRTLRLTTAQIDRLETWIAQQPLIRQHLEQAERASARVERDLRGRRQRLASLGDAADPAGLQRALRRARTDGQLQRDLDDALRDLAAADRDAEGLARQLGLTCQPAEAASLPVPVRERVTWFQVERPRLAQQIATVEARIVEEETRKRAFELRLRELALTGRVPSMEELDRARARRDQGWELVRRAWREGQDVAEAARTYGGDRELHAAYAEAVAAADEVADDLRDAGERAVEGAQARAGIEACERDLRSLTGRHARLRTDLALLDERWLAEWAPAVVVPGSAEQMQGWLDRHARLVAAVDRAAGLRESISSISERMAAHCGAVAAALTALGQPVGADEALEDLEARAEAEVAAQTRRGQQRQELQASVVELEAQLYESREELEQARAAVAAGDREWRAALEPLRLPADTSPSAATTALKRLGEAIVKIDESNVLRARREGIRRDMERYEAVVGALVRETAPDVGELPAAAAAGELEERLTRSREWAAQRAEKLALRQTLIDRLEALARTVREDGAELRELMRRLGAGTPEQLDRLVERAARLTGVREELERCEAELLQQGAGWTVEEHVRQAADASPDRVAAEVAAADERLRTLRREHEEAVRAEAAARAELLRLDGSGVAAEAAAEAQEHRARALAEAERFARLKLAHALLNREIELYRERNQAPLLRRAGELFRDLTLGRYLRLKAENDDRDRPVIVAVTGDGDERSVGQMSAGTRDQLYLALRLATLTNHVESNPPMPFVLDDVLINFDDDRARAALRVLAQLSRHTQVLLFTHHVHLVDVVRSALPGEAFAEHVLPPGGKPGGLAVADSAA